MVSTVNTIMNRLQLVLHKAAWSWKNHIQSYQREEEMFTHEKVKLQVPLGPPGESILY